MLGSVTDAEDVVQEAFLRLQRARGEGTVIQSERAFLTTVATRLAIDQLRSARRQREQYFGPWLPEPLLTDARSDPAELADMSDSLSMSFLVLLETLSPEERAVFEALSAYRKDGNPAYVAMLAARPQAVGYGLTDSPAGLAGFMLVHPGFAHWTYGDDAKQSPSRDDVLDDFTLYWLTNSATSSARIYWENRGRELLGTAAQMTSDISVPVAISVFPEEVYRAPESWARRAFPTLTYFHEAEKGGHFAAWEHPDVFAAEMRAAFRSMRGAP
jgi:pimeloyl-ACP methyl ester carboxylesterase